MNSTFIEKTKENEKFKRLRQALREFEFNPPTGFGKVLIEVDWKWDDIISVDVTTKNVPKKCENNNGLK